MSVAILRFMKSGRGQPHSKTSRREQHVRRRASVLECGCPLPLLCRLSKTRKANIIAHH